MTEQELLRQCPYEDKGSNDPQTLCRITWTQGGLWMQRELMNKITTFFGEYLRVLNSTFAQKGINAHCDIIACIDDLRAYMGYDLENDVCSLYPTSTEKKA